MNKTNTWGLRTSLLLSAATAAAVGLTGSATAQSQSGVETVVVTGSRIPQAGLISASPVTAVSQTEMQFEGTTNVENLLNNLPSVFTDFTEGASNGATGQATVDLRGLGTVRTLVLVDGKRLMPSDPTNPVADLNQIPAIMVDHVEVLTGGASAVYGSDAEAGVVNFIMRKDFEGIEVDAQVGISQAGNGDSLQGPGGTFNKTYDAMATAAGDPVAPHDWWGGLTEDVSVLMGTNTANGKGNITAYLGYRYVQPVTQAKRDFSTCGIQVTKTTSSHPDQHSCFGSANYNNWISLDDYVAGANYFFHETGTGAAGSGQFVNYAGTPDQVYNFNPLNYLQRPDERFIGGYEGHYEISPMFDLYSDFMFSDDHTRAQIAPSGAFLGTGNAPGYKGYVEINCANPLMTAQENQLLCGTSTGSTFNGTYWDGAGNLIAGQSVVGIGRRDIEGGPRIDDLRHTAYRMVVGSKGSLGNDWNYDLYGQYGITIYNENYSNEWSVSRVQNALQVNPDGHCVAFDLGIDSACVPLDIFNGIGSVTPAMQKYITAQGFKTGYTAEEVISGSVNGQLGQYGIKSPWASEGVGIALGVEWRKETLKLDTSRDFQLNDLYGQGSATLPVPASSFNVAEGFGEIQVPIIQDAPYAEDLSFNGGFRYSAYSTAGDVWSYKAGLQYQPIDDFRLRGSYERAVRAPNVLELFSPANTILFGGNDPCAGSDPTVIANCIAHGVPNAGSHLLSCPAAQCKEQVEGNLALKPEESDTFTFGAVITPTFLSGFNLTVDYFDIKVNDYITSVDPNTTLAACYGASATAASQAMACPLVASSRDPVTHSIVGSGFVSAQTVNASFLHTSGVDFEANYQFDLSDVGLGDGWGSMNINFVGTLLKDLKTQPYKGFTTYDCAGLFGVVCGTPSPEWRHKMRFTWSTPWNVQLSLDWRHMSGVSLDLNTTNPLLNGTCGTSHLPCPDLADGHIGNYDYFDLAATWDISPSLELRAGVNNVFDLNPPVVDSVRYGVSSPPFGNGNTYPGVYDTLGRTLFAAVTAKL